MSTTATPTTTPGTAAPATAKQQFLDMFDREHATTMRVLRAFPPDKTDLRPHERSKTARELAWVFVAECGLGTITLKNELAGAALGGMPAAPENWDALVAAVDQTHQDFVAFIQTIPDSQMSEPVKFFVAPRT